MSGSLDDLVNRLQTLSHPASESLPDGKRLTLLILIAQESADAIERKDAALRAALEALIKISEHDTCADMCTGLTEGPMACIADAAVAKIREALND